MKLPFLQNVIVHPGALIVWAGLVVSLATGFIIWGGLTESLTFSFVLLSLSSAFLVSSFLVVCLFEGSSYLLRKETSPVLTLELRGQLTALKLTGVKHIVVNADGTQCRYRTRGHSATLDIPESKASSHLLIVPPHGVYGYVNTEVYTATEVARQLEQLCTLIREDMKAKQRNTETWLVKHDPTTPAAQQSSRESR